MKFGLALSGGSLRGAAHIGALQALCSSKLRPSIITGTSAGSIVAGMFATGISPVAMQSAIKKFSHLSFRDLNIISFILYFSKLIPSIFNSNKVKGPLGLIKGKVLENQLKELFNNAHLKELKMPFAAVATDLHTGEMVLFTSPHIQLDNLYNTVVYTDAYLHEAVRASISIPGIFVPFYYDGRYLVDGGLKANVPSNICRHLGADKVVAIDLGFQVYEEQLLGSVFQVLMQTIDIMGQEISDLVNEYYADFVIKPALPPNIGLTDFQAINNCIIAGQKAITSVLPDLKEILIK